MRSFRPSFALVPLMTLLLVTGCGDNGDGDADGGVDGGEMDAGFEPIEPTYENVAAILDQTCTFSSCHGCQTEGEIDSCTAGKALLNIEEALLTDGDVTRVLNGVPACEYHLMPRVDPGNPSNSWLWMKLNPENMDAEGNIQFTPDPSFDPANSPYDSPNCPLGIDDFGANMPLSVNDPSPLPPNQLEAIRQWILNGAPGPAGTGDGGTDGGGTDGGGTDGGGTDGG